MHATNRNTNRVERVGIIGLGYTGLPLAMVAIEAGLQCVGFDIDENKVGLIAKGQSPVDDIADDQLQRALEAGFVPTSEGSELAGADVILICVPSPLGQHREPDLSYIVSAASTVAGVVQEGMMVILESTTYPGTTDELVVPAVTRHGLKLDHDIHVAYSPERISPGSGVPVTAIEKVVGGVTDRSGEAAARFYERLGFTTHRVGSARAAEFTKLLENTYRAVNIALANEMALLANRLNIDIWNVIEAASTKPFGFTPFWPGPGVGGHCIPLDPQYLTWSAREARFSTPLIDAAEQVNLSMPRYTADRVSSILNRRSRSVNGASILAVGVAYKPDVSDDRESAAVRVLEDLQAEGAVIDVLDPMVSDERIRSLGYHPVRAPLEKRYDLAVILTDHSMIDLEAVAEASDAVFDTRNALRRRNSNSDNFEVL